MFVKQIFSASLVIVLCLMFASAGQAADPDFVGWWKFDEGAGATVADSSGRGNDGTLEGGAAWVDGNFGGGVYIEGSSWIEIPPAAWDPIERQVTITFWAYGGDAQPVNHFAFAAYSADDNAARQASAHIPWGNGNVYWDTGYDGSAYDRLFTALPAEFHKGAWVHWTFTKDADSGEQKIYINGELFFEGSGYTRPMTGVNVFVIGCRGTSGRDQNYVGSFDDFRLYSRILNEEEIAIVMSGVGAGFPLAMSPSPEDGIMLEATWANLSWRPGSFAASHDFYFGTSFDDVNDGAEGTFVANLTTTSQVVGFPGFPAAEGLQPGTTYYWRIDEVNDANAASPWKGDIWSFWIPPKEAYEPVPADGSNFIMTNATLNWTPGFNTMLQYVYFGDNFDDVSNAAGGIPQTDSTFTPTAIETNKTYYWRVDGFDGLATSRGDVWSFNTVPDVAITNPDLALLWTLDEGEGTTAVDWSGHGNHGTIIGDAQWVEGYHNTALTFGDDVYVEAVEYEGVTGTGARTCCAWIRTTTANRNIMSWGQNVAGQKWRMRLNGTGGLRAEVNGGYNYGVTDLADGQWHHVAVTFEDDGSPDVLDTLLYVDGQLDATDASLDEAINTGSGPVRIGESPWHNAPFLDEIDDARIYTRVLAQDEIMLVMRGDPLLAWNPSPARGATSDLDNALPLTWSRGDSASSHEVYFGTDADSVKDADTSDTTGIYRGSQNGTSFTPAEGVEWGGGPYYWRVDENNADGTVTTGRIWNFTVADFILVDDFESYTDNDAENEAIWQSWIDGFGVPTNGSQVGNLLPPYAEQTIVHGGGQSMPLLYNNTAGVRNSEAVLALTTPRDWTRHDVGALSLWFRGYPPSVGSFTEGPVGTFTMTGSGADIWGTADQFHFAYKTLTGAGSIVARVESVQNTNAWAKAGVMIRETLEPGSRHAFAAVTPGNGVASQGRTDPDAASFNTAEGGITAPYWVKLERDVAGNFTVSHSSNGSSWAPVTGAVPVNIPMSSEVYVGLALTSHAAALTCEAKFSNVTITGNAGAQWMNQDIGILGNNAEPLYVSLANANGTLAVVAHDDPAAATITDWTEWVIDLARFADQGVNLADVDKIAIGLGATGDAAAAGGTGTVFIDDITLIRPAAE